jgi:hypothetical protein
LGLLGNPTRRPFVDAVCARTTDKRLEREREGFDWLPRAGACIDHDMQRACLVLVLLVALAAVGCGSGASGSGTQSQPRETAAARQVRVTVEAWLGALQTPSKPGDSARACSYLAPGLQNGINQQLRMRGEHATCKTFAAKWTGGLNPPGRDGAHVTAIAVSGKKATATLKAPPDRESDVELERVGARWLIANY